MRDSRQRPASAWDTLEKQTLIVGRVTFTCSPKTQATFILSLQNILIQCSTRPPKLTSTDPPSNHTALNGQDHLCRQNHCLFRTHVPHLLIRSTSSHKNHSDALLESRNHIRFSTPPVPTSTCSNWVSFIYICPCAEKTQIRQILLHKPLDCGGTPNINLDQSWIAISIELTWILI